MLAAHFTTYFFSISTIVSPVRLELTTYSLEGSGFIKLRSHYYCCSIQLSYGDIKKTYIHIPVSCSNIAIARTKNPLPENNQITLYE